MIWKPLHLKGALSTPQFGVQSVSMFGCVNLVIIAGFCLILPILPARTSHGTGNIYSLLELLSWDVKVSTGRYGTFSQGAYSLVGEHKTVIGMTKDSPVTVNVLKYTWICFQQVW